MVSGSSGSAAGLRKLDRDAENLTVDLSVVRSDRRPATHAPLGALVFHSSAAILSQAKLMLASQHFGLVLRCLRGSATFGQKGNKHSNDTTRAELVFG